MALEAGKKLGLYEILTPLGAGGMGEVYLANDPKLDRKVAVKVLPETLTRDAERVARFQREAKLLASLNHPNIAAIHGFDESDGARFLIMEYVEGETLQGHLKNGPVAIEDALDIAKQMAEALEAAHEQGVIHRDLKPANVMIRQDGTIKVLDFGLAKAMADDPSGSEIANSPTITANYTRPGVVLGTAAYMSPEQARGRALDKRTDIWSFGIILFECITGQRLFHGETANDSMGAIMHKDPDWSLLPPSTPPTIQLLLRRCLAKDRKRRLHDIADARIEIENALVDPNSTSLGVAQAVLDAPPKKHAWRSAVMLAILLGLIGAAFGWVLKPAPPFRVTRLTMPLPAQFDFHEWGTIKLLPDGSEVLFVLQDSKTGDSFFMLRALDQQEYRRLNETDGAVGPFFSTDGAWIAFADDDHLKKMPLRGGPPITLGDAPRMRGGTWTADGSIIFAPNKTGGLMRIPAAGGTPEPFTTISDASASSSHRIPHALPNGKGVLFTSSIDFSSWDRTSVMVVPASGGVPKLLVKEGKGAVYVAPGILVFQRRESLHAARFDVEQLELLGSPVPVLEGVAGSSSGQSKFSVDRYGTLIYMPKATESERRLVFFDRLGNEQQVGQQTGEFGRPRLSPGGRFIAVAVRQSSTNQLGVLEIDRDVLRLYRSSMDIGRPVWSSDGQWIAVSSRAQGENSNLFRVRSDLSGELERLTQSERVQFPTHWAPNGLSILFTERIPPTGDGDVMQLWLDEQGNVNGEAEVIAESPSWQTTARYSSDSKWIAYTSWESGTGQILVRRSDGSATPVRVSTVGGLAPQWSPTENVIFFLGTESFTMYSVKYTITDGKLTPSKPELVFTRPDVKQYNIRFDITADGQRFLFTVFDEEEETARREPIVVQNWIKEVEELLPK